MTSYIKDGNFSVVVKPPYEVTETGWGEFEVIIKIYFTDPNEKPVSWKMDYGIIDYSGVRIENITDFHFTDCLDVLCTRY